MDNYFATDTCTTKRNSISVCSDCRCVIYAKVYDHCNSAFCDTCFASHEVIVNSNGTKSRPGNDDLEVDTVEDDDRDSRMNMGLQGFFVSETTVTKFCFELKRKIVVPSSNQFLRGMDLNVSVLHAYNVDKCVIAPNRSNVLIYYNENEEFERAQLAVNVVGIAIGMRGCPLLLDDRTNNIYEVEYGSLKQIIQTFDTLPYALASLSNGRIVVVGQDNSHRGTGVIQIYEYYGQLIRTVRGSGEGCTLGILQSIDINKTNQDIYAGDQDSGIVYRFHENGTFASSCFILETLANMNIDIPVTGLSLIAPVPICYVKANDIVVVSCICPISRSILVLSPDLFLLGFFSSPEPMGVPVGLSIDEKGQLYIGDGVDGVIRVFAMSEFQNNIHRR